MAFKGQVVSCLPRRGINTSGPSTTIGDDQSPDCRNVRFGTKGVVKRDGIVRIAADAITGTPVVTGLAELSLSTGVNHQVASAGTGLWTRNGDTWDSIKGALTLSGTANNLNQFAQLTDKLYGCNDKDNVWVWDGSGNATAVAGLAATTTSAHAITAYKNYLFVMNLVEAGTRYETKIRWCDLNDPTTWSAANTLTLLNQGGQQGLGFARWGDNLIVFLERAIWTISYTGDALAPFVPFESVSAVGTTSGKSVIPTDRGIFFASRKGIYVFNGDGVQYVSEAIEGLWKTLNFNRLSRVVGVHNRKYNEVWFAATTGSGNLHDIVFVFDYVTGSWTVFAFAGIYISALAAMEAEYLLNPIVGTSEGVVLKMNSGSYNDDNGIITAYATSKPNHMGNPSKKKQIKRIQVLAETETAIGATIKVAVNYGAGGSSHGAFSTDLIISTQSSGGVWDTGLWDTMLWGESNLRAGYVRPQGHGEYFQIQVKNDQLDVGMTIADCFGWVRP